MSTTQHRRRKPHPSYDSYVKKVLSGLDGNASINGSALKVVSSIAANTVDHLARESKHFLAHSGHKQLSDRDVSFASDSLGDKALVKKIQGNAAKAVDRFVASKSGRQSDRAVLVFPVARIGTKLRQERIGTRVSPAAAVYVAAIAQNVVSEVLQGANDVRKADKVERITPRHVMLGIESAKLHEVCPGTVAHGGVVPTVAPAKKRKATDEGAMPTKKSK
jgi:histone H3/H4